MTETVKIVISDGTRTLFVIGGLPVGFAVTVQTENDGLTPAGPGPHAAPAPYARRFDGSEPVPGPQGPPTGPETAPGDEKPRTRGPRTRKVKVAPGKRKYHFKPGAKRGLHNHNPVTCNCRYHVAKRAAAAANG